ncbi:hypothetical protein BJV77DRAFT_1072745 [Russula vinacea]|nr:hypothetical protein BJV77DRAFT_1072745 [Russula vinacea]
MADVSDADSDSGPLETTFSLQLISHVPTVTKSGKKSKSQSKKETLTKEMKFTCDKSNYLAFLMAILEKCSLKYKVSSSHTFRFKYFYRGCPKSEALDVEKVEEYISLVDKIQEQHLLKASIIVDTEDIKQKCDSDNDDDETDGAGDLDLTPLDMNLARIRCLLETKYRSDNDSEFYYICADGTSLSLTPLRMREWALAIHSGEATIYTPPNTQTFDPANRCPSLRPRNQSSSTTASDDVTSIASFFGTLTNLINTANNSSTPPQTPSSTREMSSASQHKVSPSPHLSTPSKLHRYLSYAERHLGIHDASRYESFLAKENYGPTFSRTYLMIS